MDKQPRRSSRKLLGAKSSLFLDEGQINDSTIQKFQEFEKDRAEENLSKNTQTLRKGVGLLKNV